MAVTKRYCVEFEFSEEAFLELLRLQSQIKGSTLEDIFTNAIGVLKWYIQERELGSRVLVHHVKSGHIGQIEYPEVDVHLSTHSQ